MFTLVAVSTCDHVLARWNRGPTPDIFEWLSYLRAAPWRGGIAIVVFAADVYLGRRWLDERLVRQKKRHALIANQKARADAATAQSDADRTAQLKPLLAKRDRSTMLGHLLWQQWRQSRKTMAIMVLLSIAIPFFGLKSFKFMGHGLPILSLAFFSTLMGAMVFLPDQEQRRYRYFVEHNVPPRLVWSSRHLLWLSALTFSTLAVCAVWLFAFVDVNELIRELEIITGLRASNVTLPYTPDVKLPPFAFGVAVAATGYAIGQFFSSTIRSGILAAVFALAVGTLLFAWTGLMSSLRVGLLWSVVPIPVVLVIATLLRAPDWVAENKRWTARGRLAAVLLVPAAAILVAVPLFRLNQIPDESPGFDVADYEALIRNELADGTATAELYRKASDLLSPPPRGLEIRLLSTQLDDQDRKWLAENGPASRCFWRRVLTRTASFLIRGHHSDGRRSTSQFL